MSDKYLVHAILINWNNIIDTVDCIESLLKQTYQNVSIIIVDNGSANNEADKLAALYPQIELIRNKTNLGFCGGNNVAIIRAIQQNADYVLLINNDMIAPPELLSKLISDALTLDNLGAISPIVLNLDGQVWFAGVDWNPSIGLHSYRYSGKRHTDIVENKPYLTEHAAGCCMLIPTRAIQKVGVLNEDYFAFYDEPDLCARMARNKLMSYVTPNAYASHKVSRSTHGLISKFLLNRNRLYWLHQHVPLVIRIKSYPMIIKEFSWHIANILGLIRSNKHLYSVTESKVILLGYISFLIKQKGKWPKILDKIISAESR